MRVCVPDAPPTRPHRPHRAKKISKRLIYWYIRSLKSAVDRRARLPRRREKKKGKKGSPTPNKKATCRPAPRYIRKDEKTHINIYFITHCGAEREKHRNTPRYSARFLGSSALGGGENRDGCAVDPDTFSRRLSARHASLCALRHTRHTS